MKPLENTDYWKKTLELISDYFLESDEKFYAWAMFIGALLCVLGFVALVMLINFWSMGFWAALTAKEFLPFMYSLGEFALILSGLVGLNVLREYLTNQLALSWRNHLYKKLTKDLIDSENNYLELKRFESDVDNVDQRIQQDVEQFVTLTLDLILDFVESLVSLVAFSVILWQVGGALSFVLLGLNIVIPGYMVWISLIIALAATGITYLIGSYLSEANKQDEVAKADFRTGLSDLMDNAKNTAQENTVSYYQTNLNQKATTLQNTGFTKLNEQVKLTAFQSFYMELSQVIPYLAAAPLYFGGLIEVDQLMGIGSSFGMVYKSLSWFVNAFQDLAVHKASVERIAELMDRMKPNGLDTNPKNIHKKVREKEHINIKRLDIMPPRKDSSPSYIMRNLNLKLRPGEHVLIEGASGTGKSTLFEVLSGSNRYGSGKVSIPAGKTFYFLPQEPTIPTDTFRAILSYPQPADTYTDEQYIEVLNAVQGMDQFIPQFGDRKEWSKELSGGERQRVAIARVLLKKPDWLFLDECTSGLGEDSEDHVYKELRKMKNTTLVSIGHRSTIRKHHPRILFFKLDENREVTILERSNQPRSVWASLANVIFESVGPSLINTWVMLNTLNMMDYVENAGLDNLTGTYLK